MKAPEKRTTRRMRSGISTRLSVRPKGRRRKTFPGAPELFRLAVESLSEYALLTMNKDLRISSWSGPAAALFGYTEAEILGQSVSRLFTPEEIVDDYAKLREREAFERMGVRLYDALITKVECSHEPALPSLSDLRHIRNEELEHFHLVKRVLETLGGDATSESPCADVSSVASRDIMQVVTDPRTTVAQSLSAIMTAELTDNAGWELLIELCDTLGLQPMSKEFGRALENEAAAVGARSAQEPTSRSWIARRASSAPMPKTSGPSLVSS